MRKNSYPFTAIIGQEPMKKALLLNWINPKIGGVLIYGEKGTAKSTAVRAFPPWFAQGLWRFPLESAKKDWWER